MKTKLLIIVASMLSLTTIIPVHAENLKQQYLDKLYVTVSCPNGSALHLDMSDISMVKMDSSTQTAWLYWAGTHNDPSSIIDSYKGKWWLFTKSGKIHYLDNCIEVKTAWTEYRTFLRNHPEFLTVR